MAITEIEKRLRVLESRLGSNIPDVFAEYADGHIEKFRGLPPIEYIFKEDNIIVRTYGSSFANLVNAIMHPEPNRKIEDYE